MVRGGRRHASALSSARSRNAVSSAGPTILSATVTWGSGRSVSDVNEHAVNNQWRIWYEVSERWCKVTMRPSPTVTSATVAPPTPGRRGSSRLHGAHSLPSKRDSLSSGARPPRLQLRILGRTSPAFAARATCSKTSVTNRVWGDRRQQTVWSDRNSGVPAPPARSAS